MSVPRRTPNSHAPAGPVPDFLRHRYETSTHRVICLRSVPKTSGIGAVEALTPSTAGRAGLAQRALPRRAGRPLGPHRPRHLPTRRRVDRRLGSDRGRHAPPRRYDLPGLRTHAPRPDRRDPRRAGHRHPPLVEDTGQHRRDCVAPLRPGHILDRTRRDHDPGIGSDNRNLTHPSARSPIHSGSATKSVTNWRVTRCESGCAEAAKPPADRDRHPPTAGEVPGLTNIGDAGVSSGDTVSRRIQSSLVLLPRSAGPAHRRRST
ncbi:Uncharacterised protein [Mycobacterium tuberculosis]|nr:Uncharacterised protein [Mycobacterium tuberculosis]